MADSQAFQDSAPTKVRTQRSFTVAPSPLNPVKFELAVILLGAVLLLLIQESISSTLAQFFLLAAYGLCGMIWIVVRVRLVMLKTQHAQESNSNGAQ